MSKLDSVQKEVLNNLKEMDTPATQKSIRERIDMPKSTLSNKLRGLEKQEYVLDESEFGDNCKKYVINNDIEINTSYNFEELRDTQLTLYGLQILVFGFMIISMINVLHVTRTIAYIMYGSFLLGLIPPALLHIVQKWSKEDLYSINVETRDLGE